MKAVFVLLAVACSVMMIQGQDVPTAFCPAGEHLVLYCPPVAEPDCNNQTVHELDRPSPCGVPHCFCNTPTIRNPETGKCIQPEDC